MLNNTKPQFSYEFFPPRNPKMQRRLWRAVGQLERLNPAFFSMTYGALGSTQKISIDSAIEMQNESRAAVAAHLTCVDASSAEIDNIAKQFYQAGIKRIVALRGDSTATGSEQYTGKSYNTAVELIKGLHKIGDFDISVAAYPEVHPKAASPKSDLINLKHKLDAGANRAITQYFFDADCFLRFRDQVSRTGIDKPVIPGILPIHDIDKVISFSQRCGSTVPEFYKIMFNKAGQDEAARYRISLDLAIGLCDRLRREGVDQFHLYTLNQTDMCLDISRALGAEVTPLELSNVA